MRKEKKKLRQARKAKKRGGENAKSKSQKMFLSARAQTLEANKLYGIWIRRPQSVQPVETALW